MASVAEIVSNEIIKKLEKGVAPWIKPWQGGKPINYITGKPYRGINLLLLEAGQYLTFKQITEKGGHIRKGAKSSIVVFYKPLEVAKTEEDEPKLIRLLRYYRVFNLNDVDGIEPRKTEEEHYNFTIDNCESIVNDYISRENIRLNNKAKSDRAYYSPLTDSITLPTLEQFKNSQHYYSTAYHEMAHSTGHKSRLDRLDMKAYFASDAYGREELVAEITSAMLCSYSGIDTAEIMDNTASYCKSWIDAIKEDKNMVLVSAAKAQAAYDMILNV